MAVRVASRVCLLLALGLTLVSLCVLLSAEEENGTRRVFCVKPDSNATNTDPNCHHLSYYMANSSLYFHSNTVFQFQAGIHYLGGDLTVSDVYNLELTGEYSMEVNEEHDLQFPSSQIHCPLSDIGNMVFSKVKNLTISHLLFSGCGGYYMDTKGWLMDHHMTLGLLDSQHVTIFHTVIQNGTGIGLFGYNVQGRSLIKNSALLFNKGNSARDGGNVYLVYVVCPDTPTELVIENTLVYGGFSDMFWVVSSPSGLSIAVHYCSDVSITVRSCNITRNTAHGGWGGNVQLALISEDHNRNVDINFEDTSITDGICSSLVPGGGGGMYVFSSFPQDSFPPPTVNITGCVFSGNRAGVGGALYMYGTSPLTRVYNTTFENNVATWNGGAVFLDRVGMYSSSIDYYDRFWMGDVVFRGNRAAFGGAMTLSLASTISFTPNTTTSFTGNSASESGGAIYTTPVAQYPTCFVSLPYDIYSISCTYHVIFSQNSATYSGTDVYLMRAQESLCGLKVKSQPVNQALHLHNSEDDYSRITSGTASVYVCVDGEPQLHLKEITIDSYPGKTFNISAITIGYSNGTTYGSVSANVTTSSFGSAKIPALQQIQRIRSLTECSNLSYTVTSTEEFGSATLTLISDNALGITSGIELKVNMTGCPRGFQMQGRECGCVDLLREHGAICDVQRGTVHRPSRNVWIGFVDGGVIYYSACPYSYCKNTPQQELNLSSSDYPRSQCASHREGLLCSQCPANYSLGLGTSACLPDSECSSVSLLLILPFALAGIALVLFLIMVDLTISKGCLNGIIFYANIVWLNSDIYLPPNTPAVFKVFIAWINLSLGIKTCFYRGMDTYSKAWLAFVFPVYLWGIMLFMYVISSWSSIFTKLIRKNSVQVLATLLLLSCTKLLQSGVSTFSIGHLALPDGSERIVWYPDATIAYLSPQHVPLLFVGVFFLFLHIPYVVFLLLGHLASRLKGKKCWCSIHRHRLRLLTFSEAYTGTFKPYRKPWIGLLVLARIFLLAVYVNNYKNEVAINLAATGAVTVFLLLAMVVFRGLYTKWYLDVLEAAMLFNLWCLSISTLYTQDTPGAQSIIVSISVGMTFLVFLLIVAILLYKQLPERYKISRAIRRRAKEYREIESVVDESLASSKRLTFSFTALRDQAE